MTYHDDDNPPSRLSSKPREKSLVPGGYAGTYQDSSTSRPTENEAAAAMVWGNLIEATNTHAKMLADGFAWCRGGHFAKLDEFGANTAKKDGRRTYCRTCDATLRKEQRGVQAAQRQAFTSRRRKKK